MADVKPIGLFAGTLRQFGVGDTIPSETVSYGASTVKGALDSLTGGGSGGAAINYITTENELLLDECATLTGWTTTGGAVSVVGSEFHASGSTPSGIEKTFAPPASGDYIWYAKLRAASVAGGYAYVDFRQYPAAAITTSLSVIFGYNWVTGLAQAGCISFIGNGDTQKGVLATGFDYTAATQIAVHVDRDRSTINFFIKDALGKWALKGTTPYFAAMAATTKIGVVQGGSNAAMTFDVDRLLIARPNVVAIGDSIFAGHTAFDPDPAFYAGLDDNASSIWKHVVMAAGLTNSLVVNKGIGGQTSTQITARIAEATAHAPKLVILEASANDYGTVSATTRTSNVQSAINAITAAGASCVVANGVYVNASYGATAGAYNTYMKDWWSVSRLGLTGAAQFMDITVPVADGTGNIATANVEADGIHPNAAGYALIGEYITSSINIRPASSVFAQQASDPTISSIAAGRFSVVKNTTSGALKLWANDAGVMRSVTLV